MADISIEIQALKEAEYGEEVRGAFVSCMEKINQVSEDTEKRKKNSGLMQNLNVKRRKKIGGLPKLKGRSGRSQKVSRIK